MHNVKKLLFLLLLTLAENRQCTAQPLPDSVVMQYKSAKTGKEKLSVLYNYLDRFQGDTLFFNKASVLTDFLKSVEDTRNQGFIQLLINDQMSKTGNYAVALASTLEITNRFEQEKDKAGILAAYRQLSSSYFYAGDKVNDLIYGKKALMIAREFNNPGILSSINNNISTAYSQKNMPDSALLYGRDAIVYARKSGEPSEIAGVLGTLAEAFISNKQYDSALRYAREGLSIGVPDHDLGKAWTLNDLSQIFLETAQYDSSKYYAQIAAKISASFGFKDQLQRAFEYLSRSFDKTSRPDSAFKYLQLAVAIKDSLYSSDKTKQVQDVIAREQSRLAEKEQEKLDFQNKLKVYSLIAGLFILSMIVFLLHRNNRQKQKTNSKLQVQKEKVETTLQELKSTQQQLVQSEKMASLGELTAGIAHEIQNPLNFVNNFSEVNTELIDELVQEAEKGNMQAVKAIASDIKYNEDKIAHHGKRADAIVKGMLQHSRTSAGQKEETDINALADEYLRLAYHGLRAKDISFNATMETNYDASLGKINIVPQDIGRVILNIIANAFHAVSERKKIEDLSDSDSYQPTVSLTTRRIQSPTGSSVAEITVTDNGNGIPDAIKEKIFQPFFTTKPAGQGTGLGLSLSYDIVNAHGGELSAETKDKVGSTFIIRLPQN